MIRLVSTAENALLMTASADAEIVRNGFSNSIVVARPLASNFNERVRAAGAWAVVSPLMFAACGAGRTPIENYTSGPVIQG